MPFLYSASLDSILKNYTKSMIKQLSQQTAQDLCAQQVITSLPDSIKQLIDNSIDAKATFVKIILHEYGKSKIQVIDNGMGIDNFDFLGKKGTTSKNKLNDRFDYLGFRGEAVHSIGRVSGNMEIESKCSKDGFRRIFNVVTNKLEEFKEERLCHGQFNFQVPNRQGCRNTGTKVTIERIFQRLPVRFIQLQSKHKEFLRKTHELIKQFCLIYPEIQFVFINSREGKAQTLIETACHKRYDRTTWLERIKELDQRIANNLTYISHNLFEGFVLSKIESGSSKENAYLKKNYHFLFANRRPVDILTSIGNTLNQIYKKYNNNTKFAFVINLKLEHQMIDLNLSPNKRQIFVRKKVLEEICEELKKAIVEKVVEEIPTLSNFQDKQDKKSRQSLPASTPFIGLPQPRIDGRNPKKEIFYPIEDLPPPSQNKPSNNPFKPIPQTKLPLTKPQEKQTKSTKTTFQQIQLPKITIDRNKLKQQLNNKMGVSFSGIKRYSEGIARTTVSSHQIQSKPIDSMELEDIKKRNQQNKLRIEEEDAKRRADFMEELKEVKLEDNSQLQKTKAKATVYHSHLAQPNHKSQPSEKRHKKQVRDKPRDGLSTASKKSSSSHLGKQTLMQQQIRSKQIEEDEPAIDHQNQREIQAKEQAFEDGDNIEIQPKPKKHHLELQMRIKAKLNTDMSQIFTNFNNKKANKSQENTQMKDERQKQPESLLNPQQRQKNITVNIQDQPYQSVESQMDPQISKELGQLAPKSLKKHQFAAFNILGQFNLGFIIAHHKDTFYMVDQHAADQKYKFQSNLAKSKQPESINCFEEREITPIESDQINEAKYLLQEAGFFYKIEENRYLKLERCPIFNEKKLGMEYFNEIVNEKRQLQRISKFTAMCASMACRSAIKVGQPLGKEQMRKEVSNLALLNSPWNCPHGRPTLIQLGKIDAFKAGIKVKKQYVL